jgi:hypothetical protein
VRNVNGNIGRPVVEAVVNPVLEESEEEDHADEGGKPAKDREEELERRHTASLNPPGPGTRRRTTWPFFTMTNSAVANR